MSTEKDLYLGQQSFDSSSDVGSDLEKVIGAQISQEHEHEIKYRTCSWQKVCAEIVVRVDGLNEEIPDRRTTLLRIYMSCYLIIPMVRHTDLRPLICNYTVELLSGRSPCSAWRRALL